MRRTLRSVPRLAAAAGAAAGLVGCTSVKGPADELRPAGASPVVITASDVADERISPADIDRHIAFLAADERRGRATPSHGLTRTAAWISTKLQQAGLEPAGDDGGYIQYWPLETADGTVQVPNVVARLPGADLTRAAEYVVVMAHFDHLGVGEPVDGDSVYNGADDNASGVAALVEVAEAFGALPSRPGRPVLFLAVSGSEEGLLGSSWFASNPSVAPSEAVAVLNLDMVGRNDPAAIGVVGHGLSTLGPLIDSIAAGDPDLGLSVLPLDDRAAFRQADHFPFARRGVPGVRFFSGLHEDHHTPSDEAGGIRDEKVARVARLVFLTAHRLASGELEPAWTDQGRSAIP